MWFLIDIHSRFLWKKICVYTMNSSVLKKVLKNQTFKTLVYKFIQELKGTTFKFIKPKPNVSVQ